MNRTFPNTAKYASDEMLRVDFDQYDSNGSVAILLTDAESGEHWAVASVNIDLPLPFQQVAIKDYSENEGVAQMLIDNDVILPEPVGQWHSGFVSIGIYELSRDAYLAARTALANPKNLEE